MFLTLPTTPLVEKLMLGGGKYKNQIIKFI